MLFLSVWGVQYIDDILQKLAILGQEVPTLRGQRDSLDEEARGWSEKRDKLNQKIASLRGEAEKTKKIRDELNLKVKDLKLKRDNLKGIIVEKRMIYEELLNKIAEVEKTVPMSGRATKKRFDELEWKLQTTSALKVKDERQIIDQVKVLEKQLAIHKCIRELRQQSLDMKLEIESLRLQMKVLHSEVSKAAEASKKNHQRMLDVFKQMKELKADADKNHQTFIEVKTKANEAHSNYIEVVSQMKTLERKLGKLGGDMQLAQLKKALEFRETMGKEAAEKLRRGNKLTFDEFKILLEQGKI